MNQGADHAHHKRKFLVIIDDTPECHRAVTYASLRAKNTGSDLVLLYVIDNSEFHQFLGVDAIMREDAHERANAILSGLARELASRHSLAVEIVIREGAKSDEISKLVAENDKIILLILAASTNRDGPGPLVQSLAGYNSAAFRLPVTVIPGSLTDEELAAFA